jgi:putative endonuclease
MTLARLKLGQKGESLAVAHLQDKGYSLLQQNFRTQSGEIDCIFQDGEELVFVEVKTRTNAAFGSPLEAVDRRKWQQITRVAQEYLALHKGFDLAVRFDVVGVTTGRSTTHIDHIKNAFEGF